MWERWQKLKNFWQWYNFSFTFWAFFMASVAVSCPLSSSETTHLTRNSSSPIILKTQNVCHSIIHSAVEQVTWTVGIKMKAI